MPFSAINTYEEEVKQRNERHTLEIQLEQAMEVYQSALESQREGLYDDAEEFYIKLFAFDVLKPRNLSNKKNDDKSPNSISGSEAGSSVKPSPRSLQLGPAIRLRAMALKNYALLILSHSVVNKDMVNEALTYIAESLELVGVDDHEELVIPSLVQVAWALGDARTAKLGLEVLVQNDEGSALVPIEIWRKNSAGAELLLGPRTLEYLKALDYIDTLDLQEEVPSFLTRFNNIEKDQTSLNHQLEEEGHIVIQLASKSWGHVVSSLNEALYTSSKRQKRKGTRDPYAWSQRELSSVEFVGILFNRQDSEGPRGDYLDKADHDDEQTEEAPQSGGGRSTPPPEQSPQPPTTPLQISTEMGISPATLEVVSPYAKKRRIDRSKRSALALPSDFGVVDEVFASQINTFLRFCTAELPEFISPASLFVDQSQDIPSALLGAADLKDLLTAWNLRESNQFLLEAASSRPQKGGIMSILRSSNVSSHNAAEIPVTEFEEDEDEEEVDQFVAAHNFQHMQQIRLALARTLLSKLSIGGRSQAFASMTFDFVDGIESLLWKRRNLLSSDEVTALFGLYADMWIQKRKPDLEIKAERWKVASSCSGSLQHAWILASLDQENDDADPESSVAYFEALVESGKFQDDPQKFTHLKEISALTRGNAQLQISKFKAAAAFEKVLTNQPENPEGDDENVSLLEAMLMPEQHARPESNTELEFNAIQEFLAYAQPQFRMGLWYILLEKYEAGGSITDSLTGLTQIFVSAMAAFERGEPLLLTLSVAHDVGRRLVKLLERHPRILLEHVERDSANAVLVQIVKLLQILELFLLYDDAVNSNVLQKPAIPNWTSAALPKFRETVVLWWCIFYPYWLRSAPDNIGSAAETVNDILSIIHERLGNLGYCSLAGGPLLRLHCNEIVRMDWEGSALDMSQCLRCRFGLIFGLYGEVANHHTVVQSITEDDAKALLPYVMKMIFAKRNFNQVVMRTDTRTVIDEFANHLTTKDTEHHQQRRNLIENYLKRDFTPKYLYQAWNGHDSFLLSEAAPGDDYGVWLVQGFVLLNQYRMRRRQTYGSSITRIETLEGAINLFVDDLSSKPARFESWVGLAQALLYFCEDTLAFGNELETDQAPSDYCRQGLLAVSRAVALKLHEPDNASMAAIQPEIYESSSSTIWNILGYLLMLAVVPPLSMTPFSLRDSSKPFLVELPDRNRIAVYKRATISKSYALYIAIKCLKTTPDPSADWINAVTQARAAVIIERPADFVMKHALKGLMLAPANTQDARCLVANLTWRFYHDRKISEEEAMKYLQQLEVVDSESSSVPQLIESSLRALIEKDKWHHRSRYILAKFYEVELKDYKRAQEEMLHLFSLKSPTKPLVIWKAESELPGQHGVDMNKYLHYVAYLMFHNTDSAGLALLVRRFRKNGLEMWNHSEAYEYIYGRAYRLALKMLGMDSRHTKFSDVLMSEIGSKGTEWFETNSKRFEASSSLPEDDAWVQALFYAVELRRLNSGPATTAMADDLIIVVYIRMFKQYMSAQEPLVNPAPDLENSTRDTTKSSTDGPNASKTSVRKKVIRKDVINAAQQYLKPLQPRLSKLEVIEMPKGLTYESPGRTASE